jgi:plasmid stability protein
VRQLIARIDDELHRRLKQRASEQDRSLNDLVTSILEAAVDDDGNGALLRQRIDRSGLRVLPPAPAHARPRDEVIQHQQGSGRAVSEALEAERDAG